MGINLKSNDPAAVFKRGPRLKTSLIRGEWVNLAMGSILIWEVRDDFQCEFLAFYLAEMFKGTLCRKSYVTSVYFQTQILL